MKKTDYFIDYWYGLGRLLVLTGCSWSSEGEMVGGGGGGVVAIVQPRFQFKFCAKQSSIPRYNYPTLDEVWNWYHLHFTIQIESFSNQVIEKEREDFQKLMLRMLDKVFELKYFCGHLIIMVFSSFCNLVPLWWKRSCSHSPLQQVNKTSSNSGWDVRDRYMYVFTFKPLLCIPP